jgi:hypothetical protein
LKKVRAKVSISSLEETPSASSEKMGDAFGVMAGIGMKSALRVRAKMLGGH